MGRHRAFRKTRIAERAMFVYLRDAGLTLRSIAEKTGSSPTTVRRWVNRWNKERRLCSTVETQGTTLFSTTPHGTVRVWSQRPKSIDCQYCHVSRLLTMHYFFLQGCPWQSYIEEEGNSLI